MNSRPQLHGNIAVSLRQDTIQDLMNVRRQLISSDNSYQATTHINLKKRQLISSYNSYQSKLISENLFQIIHEIIREN